MKLNNFSDNHTQTDELARKFLKSIEKISGVNILDTQSCSGFTLELKPYSDFICGDSVTHINLTEEQLDRFIKGLEPLARG